ncbi:MAG: AI-2E family transporter [Paeniclostridium sordellii]|nr:AI-2E family transporter [Paeniclostridium sordellii]MDU7966817.1 AI-2E family transporter [Paeniclostridium sordellii]
MISRDNIKYCILVVFISLIMFKAINSPYTFILGINSVIKFLSPFLLAILICLLVNPIVMFLEKNLKLPRILSIISSYIMIFFIIGLGLNFLVPAVIDTLNTIIIEIPSSINSINKFIDVYMSRFELLQTLLPHIQKNLDLLLNNLISILSKFSSNIFLYILSVTSLLFNTIMGIILSIYILFDKEKILIKLKNLLYSTFSRKKSKKILEFFFISNRIFYHYIVGKLIDSLIIGILAFIGFEFVLNIKSSLFLSFIVFLTNMIPYFGPFIGAIFPIIMTLVYSPIKSLWVALFLLILQQIDGNFIGPKIMGDYVGISPLLIICAVLIGGSLFGLVGVFLSVPIAAIIKIYVDKYIDSNLNIEESE